MIRQLEVSSEFSSTQLITIVPEETSTETETISQEIVLSTVSNSNTDYGSNYEAQQLITPENRDLIASKLTDTDVAFICCNEGREFSTRVAPIIADIATECGVLTVAVVTMPFGLEGQKRRLAAEEGVNSLMRSAGTTIVVDKQKIFEDIPKGWLFSDAYKSITSPLHKSISIISDILKKIELINVDLADLKLIMSNNAFGYMGEGVSSANIGHRSKQALDFALASKLQNNHISDASNIIYNITGGSDMTLSEVDDIGQRISQLSPGNTYVKFGVLVDENMENKIKVSLIATSNTAQASAEYQPDLVDTTDLNIPAYLRCRPN